MLLETSLPDYPVRMPSIDNKEAERLSITPTFCFKSLNDGFYLPSNCQDRLTSVCL